MYVTDANNYRVQKFDADESFLAAFGSIGQGDGQFIAGPYGLAVDAAGNVYASDTTGRVQKFDASGRFVDGWNQTGANRVRSLSPQPCPGDSVQGIVRDRQAQGGRPREARPKVPTVRT